MYLLMMANERIDSMDKKKTLANKFLFDDN
jgi:hypothetical protein